MTKSLQNEYPRLLEIYKKEIKEDMLQEAVEKIAIDTLKLGPETDEVDLEIMANTASFIFLFILYLDDMNFHSFMEKYKVTQEETLELAIQLFVDITEYLTPPE